MLARLEIPNRVIRMLQWEHLALMLKQHYHVTIDTRELEAVLHAMGVQGDIQPFLELFHEQVVRKLGVKDTRRFDEKSLKLMLMTFLSLRRMFHPLSEKEWSVDANSRFTHNPAIRVPSVTRYRKTTVFGAFVVAQA